jgi:ankyrin repeat protein
VSSISITGSVIDPAERRGEASEPGTAVTLSTTDSLLRGLSREIPADTRLADAAKKMDRATIRALVDQHADVNQPQVDGDTALHWAANQDDLESAQLLVRAGANVKAANRYGVTPLSLACTNGDGAMVELLLKAGADANEALPGGETALMTAARTE